MQLDLLGPKPNQNRGRMDGAGTWMFLKMGGNELRYHHTEILYPHLYLGLPLTHFSFQRAPFYILNLFQIHFEPFVFLIFTNTP